MASAARACRGGIFQMVPAFIDACADEKHLAALRGKLDERLLVRRPARNAAKRQGSFEPVRYASSSASARLITQGCHC
jgi:hypothetical protein